MNIRFEIEHGLFWHNRKAQFRRFLFEDAANPKGRTPTNINGSQRIGDEELGRLISRDRSFWQKVEIIGRNYQGRMTIIVFVLVALSQGMKLW